MNTKVKSGLNQTCLNTKENDNVIIVMVTFVAKQQVKNQTLVICDHYAS